MILKDFPEQFPPAENPPPPKPRVNQALAALKNIIKERPGG